MLSKTNKPYEKKKKKINDSHLAGICFGSPFSSKVVVCGQSCDFVPHNKNIKMALTSAHLNAGVILSGGDSVAICNLPPTLRPFSPSLISLMVSVDVKHHIYFHIWNYGLFNLC